MTALDAPYRSRLDQVPGVLSHRVLSASKAAGNGDFDGRLVLRTRAGSHELLVQHLRSHVSREMASHVAATRRGSQPVLLLAPHIGSGVAASLLDAGLNYLDASGNCHIAVPPFYVHVEGKTASRMTEAQAGVRGPGYQVLFAYLAQPALLDATIRAVAEVAGVSRQPVLAMRHRLQSDKYILSSKTQTRWHPRRRDDALALWLHGYQTTVRGSLLAGTYRTRDRDPDELEARILELSAKDPRAEYRWGGTAAAFRLTRTYRGERTVVHVDTDVFDPARRLGALADPQGNLIVMRAFGRINWPPERETVHPLLVYSELLTDGSERAREAAQELHERYLAPLWNEA